jgi:hypothetical protein
MASSGPPRPPSYANVARPPTAAARPPVAPAAAPAVAASAPAVAAVNGAAPALISDKSQESAGLTFGDFDDPPHPAVTAAASVPAPAAPAPAVASAPSSVPEPSAPLASPAVAAPTPAGSASVVVTGRTPSAGASGAPQLASNSAPGRLRTQTATVQPPGTTAARPRAYHANAAPFVPTSQPALQQMGLVPSPWLAQPPAPSYAFSATHPAGHSYGLMPYQQPVTSPFSQPPVLGVQVVTGPPAAAAPVTAPFVSSNKTPVKSSVAIANRDGTPFIIPKATAPSAPPAAAAGEGATATAALPSVVIPPVKQKVIIQRTESGPGLDPADLARQTAKPSTAPPAPSTVDGPAKKASSSAVDGPANVPAKEASPPSGPAAPTVPSMVSSAIIPSEPLATPASDVAPATTPAIATAPTATPAAAAAATAADETAVAAPATAAARSDVDVATPSSVSARNETPAAAVAPLKLETTTAASEEYVGTREERGGGGRKRLFVR